MVLSNFKVAEEYVINTFPIYLYAPNKFYRIDSTQSRHLIREMDSGINDLDRLLASNYLNKEMRLPEYDVPGMNTTYDSNKYLHNVINEILNMANRPKNADIHAVIIGKVIPYSDSPGYFTESKFLKGLKQAADCGEILEPLKLNQAGGKGFFYGKYVDIKNYSNLVVVEKEITV